MDWASTSCHSSHLHERSTSCTGQGDQVVANEKHAWGDGVYDPLVSDLGENGPKLQWCVQAAIWRLAFRGIYQRYCCRYGAAPISAETISLIVRLVHEVRPPDEKNANFLQRLESLNENRKDSRVPAILHLFSEVSRTALNGFVVSLTESVDFYINNGTKSTGVPPRFRQCGEKLLNKPNHL